MLEIINYNITENSSFYILCWKKKSWISARLLAKSSWHFFIQIILEKNKQEIELHQGDEATKPLLNLAKMDDVNTFVKTSAIWISVPTYSDIIFLGVSKD